METVKKTAGAAPEETTAQRYLTLHPKTAASGIGVYLSVIVLYILGAVWAIEPPPEVAVAISGAVTTVLAWLAPRAPDRSEAA